MLNPHFHSEWIKWSKCHPQCELSVDVVPPKSLADPSCVSVMSWNILSQTWMYKNADVYQHVPEGLQAWEHRLPMMGKLIEEASPSILTLQEVDYNHWDELHLWLMDLGYQGVVQHPRHPSLNQPCGVATLWKQSEFELLPNTVKHCSRALVIGLSPKRLPQDSSPIAVVNVHLQVARSKAKTRELQLNSALKFVAQHLPDSGLILSGDFNTDSGSALHDTLRTRTWCGQRLASCYEHPSAASTTAVELATFALPQRRYQLDHIFYCHRHYQLKSVMQAMDEAALQRSFGGSFDRGLPDQHVPSDHLPIGASFKMVPQAFDDAPMAPECHKA